MKVFTLREARELLDRIKPIVADINSRKEELMEIYPRIEEEEDDLERMYYQTKAREVESLIKRDFLRIEEMGGVVKGVDPILIDFLSYHGGRYIWLCWREDEETIMFWHELNDGFTGRKPVNQLEGQGSAI